MVENPGIAVTDNDRITATIFLTYPDTEIPPLADHDQFKGFVSKAVQQITSH